MSQRNQAKVAQKYTILTEQQLRRTLYLSVFLCFLLPPFVGGTLMVLVGFYPFPEFYLVFLNYHVLLYMGTVIPAFLAMVPGAQRYIVSLTSMDRQSAMINAQRTFSRLPWFLFGTVTLYSIGGALSADFALEAAGVRDYSLYGHLNNQFGLIPVVLITVFPIFFYFIDRLGRYLAPRGIHVVAISLWMKLLMLGIVTPILIDSLLIGYYHNRTGYFEWDMLVLWASLAGLAAGGTWFVWRSLQQGMAPLEMFIAARSGSVTERAYLNLAPLSLDEHGLLTARYAELLTTEQQLLNDLQRTQLLSDTIVENIPSMIFVKRADDLSFVLFNRAGEELTGFARTQLLGKNDHDFFPKEQADYFNAKDRLVLDVTGFEDIAEEPIDTLSRGHRLLHTKKIALRDAEGLPVYLLGISEDITERRKVEQHIQQQARLLDLFFKHSVDSLVLLDKDYNFIRVSDSYARSCQRDVANFAGHNHFELYPSDLKEEVEPFRKNKQTYSRTERPFVFPDHPEWGTTYWDLSMVPVLSQDGEIELFVFTLKDVSERVKSVSALASFKHTLDSTLDAVFIFDPVALQFSYVNQGATDQLGYRREELLALHPYDLKPEFTELSFRELLAPLQCGEQEALRFETLHRAKDGTDIPVEVFLQYVTPTDDVPRFVNIVHDIRERKQAENKLREMNESLELLVKERTARLEERELQLRRAQNIARLGHWTLNVPTGDATWSEEIYRIFGHEPHAFLPTRDRFLETVHPDDRELLESAESKSYAAGKALSIDHRIVLPDKSVRWVHEEGMAEYDANGRPLRLTGTVQDVTERKQAETDLREARDTAERASRAKSDFLSRMSHELRTPMNAILGFEQLLEFHQDHPLDPVQRDNVQEILRAGRHLLELINEVLDLARVESGRTDLVLKPVALAPIIEATLAQIRPLAEQRHISIEATTENYIFNADPLRLRQVLLNLLSNAAKYNRDNGSIRVTCAPAHDGWARLAVHDTGRGISAEGLARLFQPFERLENAYDAIEGTGIGLALSKRLVEAMGGRIGVDSVAGEGSTFWVQLPLSTATVVAASVDANKAMPDLSTVRTLLYMEDDPANLRLMQRIISTHSGWKLLDAHNAELGLELAFVHRPDLILMDINLPGMSGFDALQRLRAHPATCSTPVIAITANAMPRDIERGRAAGFSDYLTKPLDVPQFLNVIDRLVLVRANKEDQ